MKFAAILIIFATALLILPGCQSPSSTSTLSAEPIVIPFQGNPGEYITVKIKVVSNQPCELILARIYQTVVTNYFSLSTTRKLTYPDNINMVTWNEKIPEDIVPGVMF